MARSLLVLLAALFLVASHAWTITSGVNDDEQEMDFRQTDLEFAIQRKEMETPTMGAFRLMVLRIVALDSEPTASADELYNLTFVDDVSLKKQLFRCSFGKLDIQPKYGVLNVPISMNIRGVDRAEVIKEAYRVAPSLVREYVTDVRSLAEGVMLVLPPGTEGSWAAFGTVGGKQSLFNNQWATYAGAAIHEVSHNLGLYHAYQNGVE